MMPASTEEIVARARVLVQHVLFDDRGLEVAGGHVPGNGGILSRDTVLAAEMLEGALGARDGPQERFCDHLHAIAARAIIAIAATPPSQRGPWIFDEYELQAKAREARAFLAGWDE